MTPVDDQWREILREVIVFGMLFKAVAHDASTLDQTAELKLSYRSILDLISSWAERKHHEYRQQFAKMGGKIHSQKLQQDGFLYNVLVTVRGYQQEAVLNVEVLKAECQVRLNQFLQDRAK